MTSPLAPLTRINPGLLMEPPLLTNAVDGLFERFGGTGTPKDGFYVELSNMITGSGFVSIGPGYRHQLLNDRGIRRRLGRHLVARLQHDAGHASRCRISVDGHFSRRNRR